MCSIPHSVCVRLHDTWQQVTGEVDLTDKVPDDKFALKTTTLTKWGSCKPRSESRLAQCRIACARFSVCGVMACRNLGEHAMAQYVVQCYAVCNESPESIISSYSNISCYAVACAINGTKSFLATSVGATVCIPEPLYDGRPPDGGIVTLPFDDDGLRITGFNNTPAPVGPQYCTDTSSSSSSSTGRRRLLDFSPWRSLFSAGSDKGVDSISTQAAPAPAAAPVDPSVVLFAPHLRPSFSFAPHACVFVCVRVREWCGCWCGCVYKTKGCNSITCGSLISFQWFFMHNIPNVCAMSRGGRRDDMELNCSVRNECKVQVATISIPALIASHRAALDDQCNGEKPNVRVRIPTSCVHTHTHLQLGRCVRMTLRLLVGTWLEAQS
eukprot:jgi/Mesen1/8584/ME000005S08548